MILYGIERYFIEFLRDDPGRGEVFGGLMTGTQLISIVLVIGGGLIWWLKSGTQHSALSPQKSGTA
jgi:prolipoprotein diacylglyceryltransferase